jgi:hypothetical protein
MDPSFKARTAAYRNNSSSLYTSRAPFQFEGIIVDGVTEMSEQSNNLYKLESK